MPEWGQDLLSDGAMPSDASGDADDFERRPGHPRVGGPAPRTRWRLAVGAAVAAIAGSSVVVAMVTRSTGVADPLHVAGTPPPREAAAMAYDSVAGETLMYGGRRGTSDLYDTWLWNGGWWTPMSFPNGPRVSSPALADDPGDGGALLVGMATQPLGSPQTWLFRGGAWHLLSTGGDGPRPPVTMATVPTASTVVAVADTAVANCTGTNCSSSVVSTWYWREDHWVADSQVLDLFKILLLVPSTTAGRLELVSVVAPPIPSCINGDGACPVNTFPPHWWHWGSGSWVADTPTTNPPPLQSGLVADAGTRSVLLVPNGQSWVLSRGTWVQLPDSYPGTPRYHAALAIDRNGAWVLFGGTTPTGGAGDDTWLLGGDATWRHVAGKPPVRSGSQSIGA